MLVEARSTPPDDWTGLVASDPGADFFHTVAWTRAVARHLPGGAPCWLTARADGRLLAGLAAVRHGGRLRRLHSSAHGCSGGVLAAADAPPAAVAAARRALVDALVSARGGGLASCAIGLNPVHEEVWGAELAADTRFRRQDNPAAVVPLDGGPADLAARLRRSKRKERDRSLRRGVVAAVSADPDDLAAYHRLHAAACRRWRTAPVPLALLRELVGGGPGPEGGEAYFVCVRLGGEVLGGHLNLHLGPWVTAWNGVTDPARARTHYPATLAVWTDMLEARRRGARWLDLGASGGQHSLDFFKEGFGARTRPRGWYVADAAPARLLRGLRRALAPARPPRRWHDGTAP